jgi:NADH-quinone oxidoreductase subunit A
LWAKSVAGAGIKDTAYECGMLPIGEGNSRLSIRFYIVAMLFILFDIEVIFLYPWAVVYKQMLADNAALILGSMLVFYGHSLHWAISTR